MRADHHEPPRPRTTLRTGYVRVLVWCKSCRRRRDADLQGLIDAGRGDVPLVHPRFRCSNWTSQLTDFRGDVDGGDGPTEVITSSAAQQQRSRCLSELR